MTKRQSGQLLMLLALLIWGSAAPLIAPAAPKAFVAPEPPVPPLDEAPFGLNTHLATRYPNLDSLAIPAQLVAQAGVGWAREDIHWWRTQPSPGIWDWSFSDAALRELIQRNINIVGVLGHPPGWVTPYPGDKPMENSFYPPDPAQFAAFAQAVVQRYGRYVHHWEIWNEPDNPLFWKPAPDAHAYALLLRDTARAIRAIDPNAHILIGGINPFDTRFLEQIAEDGVWDSFDIIAIHPYVDPATPEAGNLGASADGVRALAARFGAKPLWVTEIGWASGRSDHDRTGMLSEQDQANLAVRAMLLLWRAGIERIFWYTLKDDPGNPYGLVALGTGRADYRTLKPAFYALQTLNQQLAGASFVGMRDLFTRTTVFDFESIGMWRRGDQPYGELEGTSVLQHSGQAARLSYDFPTAGNDYVVFMRDNPVIIPQQAYALGIWVYGDGSGNTLKIWLRDAESELLQYALGTVGPAGWRLLQAPIDEPVAEWNRISASGNGRLDGPASLYALVLDDAPDSFIGSGALYLDDLTAISGPEGYDLQVQRGDQALDVLWAPEGVYARLPTSASSALVFDRNGQQSTLAAQDNSLTLQLGPAPIYVQHKR